MGHSKHRIRIEGETLIERTVRLVHEYDKSAEVIITSHDVSLSVVGAERYEPKNNVLEIDRFTAELIEDDMCFLYGDVLYSEQAMETIVSRRGISPVLFFGSRDSICAVLIKDGALFKDLYLEVRRRYVEGEISECKGWQVYQSYAGLPFGDKSPTDCFVFIEDETRDFNSPKDLEG